MNQLKITCGSLNYCTYIHLTRVRGSIQIFSGHQSLTVFCTDTQISNMLIGQDFRPLKLSVVGVGIQ